MKVNYYQTGLLLRVLDYILKYNQSLVMVKFGKA